MNRFLLLNNKPDVCVELSTTKQNSLLIPRRSTDFSDCACSTNLASYNNVDEQLLGFANRGYELDQILKPSNTCLMIINAPARYGKSALLRQAEKRSRPEERDQSGSKAYTWKCIRLELNGYKQEEFEEAILNEIAGKFGIELREMRPDKLLGKISEQGDNVLFLFDAIDFNPQAARWLKSEIVQPLDRAWRTKTGYFRVVFAGRCVNRDDWSNYRYMEVDFLGSAVVRKIVFDYTESEGLVPGIQELVFETIMDLSCGHPRIIANILHHPPNGSWSLNIDNNQFLPDSRKKIVRDCVEPVVNGILDEIQDENLRQISQIMSVFRKFSINTIEALQSIVGNPEILETLEFTSSEKKEILGLLKPFSNLDPTLSVFRDLVKTSLIHRTENEGLLLYGSGLIHKLLVEHLQRESESKFRSLNKLAHKIYQCWLDGHSIDGNKNPYALIDGDQRDCIVESFCHFLNSLTIGVANNELEIKQNLQGHAINLKSFIGNNQSVLREKLHKTMQHDKDIPKQLQKMFGGDSAQNILTVIIEN